MEEVEAVELVVVVVVVVVAVVVDGGSGGRGFSAKAGFADEPWACRLLEEVLMVLRVVVELEFELGCLLCSWNLSSLACISAFILDV